MGLGTGTPFPRPTARVSLVACITCIAPLGPLSCSARECVCSPCSLPPAACDLLCAAPLCLILYPVTLRSDGETSEARGPRAQRPPAVTTIRCSQRVSAQCLQCIERTLVQPSSQPASQWPVSQRASASEPLTHSPLIPCFPCASLRPLQLPPVAWGPRDLPGLAWPGLACLALGLASLRLDGTRGHSIQQRSSRPSVLLSSILDPARPAAASIQQQANHVPHQRAAVPCAAQKKRTTNYPLHSCIQYRIAYTLGD